MDAARWRQVRELFDKIVDYAAEERESELLRQCPDDAALRSDVLAMLRSHVDAGALDSRIVGSAPDLLAGMADAADQSRTDAWTGRQLGAWRIVRPIGRGGMGVVYLAERDDGQFHHRAAIKMLRGWDDSVAIARLVSERQILAGLEHPNIARLLDGGSTEESGPWFALEYIDGIPLDIWSDTQRLDLSARLDVFLKICEAVAYAHEHLVVHRDLKPANILVDPNGRVVLLDFGIAKLLDTDAAQTGTALRVFTPEYAAPEQVRGEIISTAVDVYALGVVLYELLTGQRPYRVATRSAAAIERAILEQDAARPSASVVQNTLYFAKGQEDLNHIAARRRLTPSALQQRLRGDLDAIVLKALRKEPSQRYATVREFAADIRSMQAHRPVAARRGGLRYVATRFLRRNLIAVSMGTLAATALLIGLLVALNQTREARIQRDTARQSLDFMTQLFENADPGMSDGGELSVRDLLDEGVRSIRHSIAEKTPARAELMLAMASAYGGLELNDAALPLILEAKQIAELADDWTLFARAAVRECRYLNYKNEFASCSKLADEAAGRLDPARPDHGDMLAGLLARRVAEPIANEQHPLLIELITPALARLKPSRENQETRVTLTAALADAHAALGRHNDAERLMRSLVDQLLSEPVVNPRNLANAKNFLSDILNNTGQTDEALRLNREVLEGFESLYGKDNPINSTKMNNFAFALYNAGRLEQAIEILTRVIEMNRDRAGGAGPGFGVWLNNLGAFLLRAGRDAEALRYLTESVDHFDKPGQSAGNLVSSLWWRGAANLAVGDFDAARSDFARSARSIDSQAADHPARLRSGYSLLAMDIIQQRHSSGSEHACQNATQMVAAYAAQEDPHMPDVAIAHFSCRPMFPGDGIRFDRRYPSCGNGGCIVKSASLQ